MPPPRNSIVAPEKHFAVAGVCPHTQQPREFDANLSFVKQHGDEGVFWKYNLGRFLHLITASPVVIFEGLEREGLEDGFCYCGRFEPVAINESTKFSLPENRVVVVFVQCLESGFEIFEWDKREEDADRPGWPINWKADFRKVKWPQQ